MLPWAEMWRAGLRAGLSPQAFWRLSLREWRWLCGAGQGGLARQALEDLMEAYPDE